VKLVPIRFAPAFYPRIWGARSLAPLFPDAPVAEQPIGEAWLTGNDCVLAAGPWAGHKVAEAWPKMAAEWAGTRLAGQPHFPLLVKYIFPEDKLSVQVHPNDDYARKHEAAAGGLGKTEMWYVVSARPGAQVMVGLKPGVTAESFRQAIVDGQAEDCVEHRPVHAGDAIFVPAGTVHTVGPGVVLCEIQENSDLTYRVYDYNRRDARGRQRPLHVEKAFDVINFGEQRGGKITPVTVKRGKLTETYFIACRYFAIEKWEFSARIAAQTSSERFDLLVILEGHAKLAWGGNSVELAPAQVWMLPAGLGAYHLEPREKTALLRAYVPDIQYDFVRRLAEQRVEQAEWSRLVYP
jgi:mannose-6-phosphate isomerase